MGEYELCSSEEFFFIFLFYNELYLGVTIILRHTTRFKINML